MNATPDAQFAVTDVVHGVNVTVPLTSEYDPTFGTSRDVDPQFGADTPTAHNRVLDAVNVTPAAVVSFTNKFTVCVAPTTPDVEFATATDTPGGVTVGVIVADAVWFNESCTT